MAIWDLFAWYGFIQGYDDLGDLEVLRGSDDLCRRLFILWLLGYMPTVIGFKTFLLSEPFEGIQADFKGSDNPGEWDIRDELAGLIPNFIWYFFVAVGFALTPAIALFP